MGFYTISVVDLRFTVRGPRWRHDWPTVSMFRARIGGFIVFRSPDLKTYETYLWSDQPALPMDCIPEWAFKGFREGNPYKEKQHDMLNASRAPTGTRGRALATRRARRSSRRMPSRRMPRCFPYLAT